jgi:hypothetical protein
MEVGKMPAQRKTNQSRRLTAAGLIAVTAATLLMMAWAIFPTAAFADGTVNWNTNGAEHNVPCEEGESPGFHWIFTTGGGKGDVTDADLFVNGSGPFQMTPNASKTQWDADVVSGKVVSAHVDFKGTLGQGQAVLTISHGCFEEETTTTSTTETTATETTATETTATETTATETTATETTTATTATTTTTTPGGGGGGGTTTITPPASTTPTTTPPFVAPTTIHNTSTTATAEVLPTTVRPGKLAFTGIEDVVPIGALALTLVTTGSGLLWAGSRRRRSTDAEDEG